MNKATKEMSNPKLSPPWWEFYNKLKEMFGQDPEIHMDFDEGNMEIKMFVDNQAKADGLAQFLPEEKDFGNVKLKLTVIPSDKAESKEQLFKTIFNGNPIFHNAVDMDKPGFPSITYVVFSPKIVQFYNDNLADINGNITTLPHDIAKDLFVNCDQIYFCTDNVNSGYPW